MRLHMTMTNIKKLVKIILSKHSITKKNTSLTSDSNDHYHKPADTILIKYSLFFFSFFWGVGGGGDMVCYHNFSESCSVWEFKPNNALMHLLLLDEICMVNKLSFISEAPTWMLQGSIIFLLFQRAKEKKKSKTEENLSSATKILSLCTRWRVANQSFHCITCHSYSMRML